MPSDDRRGEGPGGLNRAAKPAPDDRRGAGPEGLKRAVEPTDDRRGAGPEGLKRAVGPLPWRRTGSRTALRDGWIHLRAETWETPKGVTLDPWWMLDWADWVHVVALTADDRLVLVRQFRPGAQAVDQQAGAQRHRDRRSDRDSRVAYLAGQREQNGESAETLQIVEGESVERYLFDQVVDPGGHGSTT